jgi:hypothetical protein
MINIHTKDIDGVWFGVAYDGESIFATTFASSKDKALQVLRERERVFRRVSHFNNWPNLRPSLKT